MNLILVRHGETEWNRIGRCQGFSDVELNDNGRKQIEALAKSLRNENISAIYSSDLKRATDTANAIAKYHDLPLHLEHGLREMDQGELEGLTFVEIKERYADLMMEWRVNTETVRLPGGESLKEVQERAWRVIEAMVNRHLDETVVTVSHNLTIIALLCKFTGVGLAEFTKFRLQATSKNLVLFKNGHTRVDVINDVRHLSPDLITKE